MTLTCDLPDAHGAERLAALLAPLTAWHKTGIVLVRGRKDRPGLSLKPKPEDQSDDPQDEWTNHEAECGVYRRGYHFAVLDAQHVEVEPLSQFAPRWMPGETWEEKRAHYEGMVNDLNPLVLLSAPAHRLSQEALLRALLEFEKPSRGDFVELHRESRKSVHLCTVAHDLYLQYASAGLLAEALEAGGAKALAVAELLQRDGLIKTRLNHQGLRDILDSQSADVA